MSMRPLDVMDEIIGFNGGPRTSQDVEGAAMRAWGAIVESLRPDDQVSPLSLADIERAKQAACLLADALDRAIARKPPHLRPVDPN